MQLKTKIIIISAIILLSLGALFAFTPMRTYFLNSGEEQKIKQSQSLYTCPMHPQIIQDKMGSCPICGMDLVPMQNHSNLDQNMHDHGDHSHTSPASSDANPDDEEQKSQTANTSTGNNKSKQSSAPGAIQIRVAPAVVQKMGVRTAVVERREITREIRSVAHIDFAEDAEAVVNARFDGWVEKLYVRVTGQRVRRGQALAGVYSPELVATQAEYLQLFKSLKHSGDSTEIAGLLKAARQRLELWNISKAQIRALEKRGRPSRLLNIYAPISGVVTEKKVVQGARIQEGMDLFRIINLSRVWAYMHVPEKDIQFVKLNLPVQMEVPQLGAGKFDGKINFIFPYLQREARDLRVRVSFANPDYKLKPGMYATLKLKRTLPGMSLTVPSSSVIRTGERELVFVHYGEGLFEPRKVITGVPTGDDHLQILQGLNDQEAVVVSGQFLLDSETRIQEAVRKMQRQARGHQH